MKKMNLSLSTGISLISLMCIFEVYAVGEKVAALRESAVNVEPEPGYVSNVVVEELTATGCTFCPSGIGALEYYAANYPGSEEQGKAINIAVHGFVSRKDPMSVGVEEYEQALRNFTNYGYPSAAFNRGVRSLQPTAKAVFENEIQNKSYSFAKIDGFECPEAENEGGQDFVGKEVTVHYSVKTAYTTSELPLNASIILVEDKVKGTGTGYAQTNFFARQDESVVSEVYGEWLVPYMTQFLKGGELGESPVPAEKMVYNHVARLCYPSFGGMTINTEWNEDEYRNFDISFSLPDNVIDFRNLQVVLIITDTDTGKIVASDIQPLPLFDDLSRVTDISENSISIVKVGDVVEVQAAEGTKVFVYSVDGLFRHQVTVVGDKTSIPISGPVIVKVVNQVMNKVVKIC